MRATVVRVVEQKRVAVAHALGRERAHEPLRRELQGPEMDRNRRGLRDGLAPDVEQRGRRVEALFDDRRRRALEQRQLHLVGDRVEPVAEDLEEDRIDRHQSRRKRRLPASSTSAPTPGGMTVVVSLCSTMAGPASRAPSGSRVRS